MTTQLLSVLAWYILVTALGWLVWPLAFRLLPGLADRGYTFSRALGLLLVGYVFWLLGVLGLLNNSTGGILLAALLLGGLALWVNRAHPSQESLREWIAANRRVIISTEVLFAVAFFGWVIVRAYNPAIQNTEKPMELAFLNGTRLSPTLPPRDPWLAGYGISYYYFGYVIVAMLADLAGTASGVAFNLGIAMLFALTIVGAYGAAYNLLAARRDSENTRAEGASKWALNWALLGPLFVGVMGNIEGLFEMLRALNIAPFGGRLYTWLDIQGLVAPTRVTWPLDISDGWWWWQASRVIYDRAPSGAAGPGIQPIDEFPMFSFLLGDMHPHVLALPFVLLALMLAFNILAERKPQPRRFRAVQAALYVVAFGGLAFLNTWDMPIYLFVLVGAMLIRRVQLRGWFDFSDAVGPVVRGAGVAVLGLIAYTPWIISFGSQAGGILPNALFPTRLHQFFVMFGPLLVVAVAFAVDQAIRQTRNHRADWISGATLGVGLLLLLAAAMTGMGAIALRSDAGVQNFVASMLGTNQNMLREVLIYRLTHPLTALLLTALIVMVLTALMSRPLPVVQPADGSPLEDVPPPPAPYSPSSGFVLLLILTGAMLTLGVEFVYLRDNFGQRMNTVFKFYYAAWILWSIAAAYGTAVLLTRRRGVARFVLGAVVGLLVLAGMVYPVLGIPSKTGNFGADTGQSATLDGIDYIRQSHPGDYAAIQWLQQNAEPDSIVLEATGGAYSYYGRVSSTTGLPTLLGWANHEQQWRGEDYGEMAGTREQDIREIYNTPSAERARRLLEAYDVTYVFVGSLERDPEFASTEGIAKFDRFLTPVYQEQGVTIYRADQPLVQEGT